jgi:glycine/D-amino acid oxidase-like deaminating enzyme
MSTTRSIVIVGAGVFGLTAAWELALRGWQVLVLDPGDVPHVAAASTDISKVVRADYGGDELYTAMAETALSGWDRWNDRWGETLYHQDGFLVLSEGALQPGRFEYDSFALLERRGHRLERLREDERGTRFPAWSSAQYPDGYFNPRAGWVESGRVVAKLALEARAAGVRLRERVGCDRLLEEGGRIMGIQSIDGGQLRADAVLLAMGAWTPSFLPDLGDVMWATAQPVVHFRVDNPAAWQAPHFPVWAADIGRSGWYGFPAKADGTLKIANHGPGRRVQADDPRTVLSTEKAKFRTFVGEHLPALASAPIVATRLCLYCDTFDGDFWIAADPTRAGLIVAAGDSGHAFKFAPVLGRVIADAVEAKPNPWSHRFRWRTRGSDAHEAARAMVPGRRGADRSSTDFTDYTDE